MMHNLNDKSVCNERTCAACVCVSLIPVFIFCRETKFTQGQCHPRAAATPRDHPITNTRRASYTLNQSWQLRMQQMQANFSPGVRYSTTTVRANCSGSTAQRGK